MPGPRTEQRQKRPFDGTPRLRRAMPRAAVVLAAAALLAGAEAAPAFAIDGGTPAAYGQIPSEVAIQNPDGSLDCSGTILDATHVLTAASCVTNLDTLLGSLTGGLLGGLTVRYDSLDYASGGTVDAVAQITDYPGYDPLLPDENDIAVLTLANPITYDTDAQPAALPAADSSDPAPGTPATISGYGATQPGGPDAPVLQRAQTSIVSRQTCQNANWGQPVTTRQICTLAQAGTGTDSGDGGGPLVVNGQVVGVSDANQPPATGQPNVYTKVASLRDWIKSEV
jgi:trypsin